MFENVAFCRSMEAAVVFALCHRWMGGTVIAGVRSVAFFRPKKWPEKRPKVKFATSICMNLFHSKEFQ